MKKLFSFILFLVFVYVVFVLVDCFRIKNSDQLTQPLLIFDKEEKENEMIYTGLGYKVYYTITVEKQSYDLEVVTAEDAKFVLFDIFTVWDKKYNK